MSRTTGVRVCLEGVIGGCIGAMIGNPQWPSLLIILTIALVGYVLAWMLPGDRS